MSRRHRVRFVTALNADAGHLLSSGGRRATTSTGRAPIQTTPQEPQRREFNQTPTRAPRNGDSQGSRKVSGVRETESSVRLQERHVPGALEEGRVRQVSERSVVVNRGVTLTGSADADTPSRITLTYRPGTDCAFCECPKFVWRWIAPPRRYPTRKTSGGHGRRDGGRRGDDVPREGHQLLTAPALPCWQLSSSAPDSGDRFASPMVLSSAGPGRTSSTCPAHCSTPAGKPTG
jgi:hypothetical protein